MQRRNFMQLFTGLLTLPFWRSVKAAHRGKLPADILEEYPAIGQEVTINSKGDLWMEVESRIFIGKPCIVTGIVRDKDESGPRIIVRLRDEPEKKWGFDLMNVDWKEKSNTDVAGGGFDTVEMVHHRGVAGKVIRESNKIRGNCYEPKLLKRKGTNTYG